MIITIEVDDRYKGIIEELTKTARATMPSEMLEMEMHEIIRSNLDDYGFNEDGTKKSEDDPFELCHDPVFW